MNYCRVPEYSVRKMVRCAVMRDEDYPALIKLQKSSAGIYGKVARYLINHEQVTSLASGELLFCWNTIISECNNIYERTLQSDESKNSKIRERCARIGKFPKKLPKSDSEYEPHLALRISMEHGGIGWIQAWQSCPQLIRFREEGIVPDWSPLLKHGNGQRIPLALITALRSGIVTIPREIQEDFAFKFSKWSGFHSRGLTQNFFEALGANLSSWSTEALINLGPFCLTAVEELGYRRTVHPQADKWMGADLWYSKYWVKGLVRSVEVSRCRAEELVKKWDDLHPVYKKVIFGEYFYHFERDKGNPFDYPHKLSWAKSLTRPDPVRYSDIVCGNNFVPNLAKLLNE